MVNEAYMNEIHEILSELDNNRYQNSKKTVELGKKALSMCKEANYELGIAVALLRMAEAYMNIGKYEEAIPYYFDSLNVSEKLNVYDLQVAACNGMGIIFLDLANYEKSMDFYTAAEKIVEKIDEGIKYDKSSSYEFYASKIATNIGEIYKYLNSYEDALIYYNKSVSFDRKLNYAGTRGASLFNLAEIEYKSGNYDKALKLVDKSIEYMKLYNFKSAESEPLRLMALIEEKKGNYDKAEKYFNKAINISDEIANAYYKIDAYIDYSSFLNARGNDEDALVNLQKAYNISLSNEIYIKTLECCIKISEIYEELNNLEEAHKYYKLYYENERKLEHIRSEQRINSIKIKTKLEQLEKEKRNILEKSELFRRKSEELAETVKNISIISELGQKITSTLNLDEIVNMLYDSVQDFVVASSFGIWLYDDKKRVIQFNYIKESGRIVNLPDVSIDSTSSIAAYCLRNRKFIVINDMSTEYSNYVDDKNYIVDHEYEQSLKSLIYSPLIINNALIGVMSVQSIEKNAFTELHIEMLKALSSYAAIAVNNAIKSMHLQIEIEQRKQTQEKLEELNNKLRYLSENDGLTGIPNRRKFDSFINSEWDIAKRGNTSLAVILFDMDCFKQFNDNYGHVEGDNCIVEVAKLLAASLTGDYFAARYGGDEFVVVLPKTGLDAAMKFAENLRKSVENLNIVHAYSRVKRFVTITLGVASVIPNNCITINELIRMADNALYDAKERGRNQSAGFQIAKSCSNG